MTVLVLGIYYGIWIIAWETVLVAMGAFPGLFSRDTFFCIINIIDWCLNRFGLIKVKSPDHSSCPKRTPVNIFHPIRRCCLYSGLPKNICYPLIYKERIRIISVLFGSICYTYDHIFIWDHLPDISH